MSKKYFNYSNATALEVACYWLNCATSQSIYSIRQHHKDNLEMTSKLNEAYILYKTHKLRGTL